MENKVQCYRNKNLQKKTEVIVGSNKTKVFQIEILKLYMTCLINNNLKPKTKILFSVILSLLILTCNFLLHQWI